MGRCGDEEGGGREERKAKGREGLCTRGWLKVRVVMNSFEHEVNRQAEGFPTKGEKERECNEGRGGWGGGEGDRRMKRGGGDEEGRKEGEEGGR